MNKKTLLNFLKFYIIAVLSLAAGFGAKAQTAEIYVNPGTSPNIVGGASSYHLSESIFLASEVGTTNFLTAATAIDKIEFNVTTVGANTTYNNYSIYLKEVAANIDTLPSGPYSLTDYTQVYTGSITFTAVGWSGVVLSTPFVRTSGTSNLQMLITRTDGVAHAGFVFAASVGNTNNFYAGTTRRYNSATAPTATSSLAKSTFRPAVRFIHRAANDAAATAITVPTATSCFSTIDIPVVLSNNGTTNIAPGTASVTLSVAGANSYTNTATNATVINVGSTGTVTFTGVNVSGPGQNDLEAIVTYIGDANQANDTVRASFVTGETVTNFPVKETFDSAGLTFGSVKISAGTRQLWRLNTGGYTNADAIAAGRDSLRPYSAPTFALFDAYSGANSAGSSVILYSGCFSLPAMAPNNIYNVSFYMSHDTLYSTGANASPDSLFVVVSTDKGTTWTRIGGFARIDMSYANPGWRQETIDLAPYAGQTIQIGFEGVSQYGNVFGLDDITVTANNLFPVTLVNFTGERAGSKNNLSWSTESESNNAGFELQRSANGLEFSKISYIPSRASNGSSSRKLNYEFSDLKPFTSGNYYRLKQLDKDGKFRYSNVVLIKSAKASSVNITAAYPNPTINNLKLIIASPAAEKATVVVTDLAGKVVMQRNAQLSTGDNNIDLNVQGIAKGTYTLKVVGANGNNSSNVKFVKQ